MRTVPVLLAIILVTIPSVAFAQSPVQITILTDKQSYTTGDTISISGTISSLGTSTSAVLQVYNPFNVLVQIGTIPVASDGSFHYIVKTEGQSWSNDGLYQIRILYVSAPILATSTVDVTFTAAQPPPASSPPPASVPPQNPQPVPQQSSQTVQQTNTTIVTPSDIQTPIQEQIKQRIALANKLKQQLDQGTTTEIPFWVKDTAQKWHDGTINNIGFSKDIQYFIASGLVKENQSMTPTGMFYHIPSWVKQVTVLWTRGAISDYDYVNTIQFLLGDDIIR